MVKRCYLTNNRDWLIVLRLNPIFLVIMERLNSQKLLICPEGCWSCVIKKFHQKQLYSFEPFLLRGNWEACLLVIIWHLINTKNFILNICKTPEHKAVYKSVKTVVKSNLHFAGGTYTIILLTLLMIITNAELRTLCVYVR